MRRIEIKEQEDKKKKRNQLIVGLILVVLMFVSVAGYAFVGNGSENKINSNKIVYNGFDFYNQNDFWILNNKNPQLIFKYNPEQTKNISVNVNQINDYYNKPLYIFSEDVEAELEIYKNLQGYSQRIQRACVEGNLCNSDIPIKTCEDNFIIIKKSETTNILQDNNCVIIEGAAENLTMIADEFLFRLFKIKQ